MSNSFVFINDNNELHKLNMNVTSNQNDLTFDNNLIINGNVDPIRLNIRAQSETIGGVLQLNKGSTANSDNTHDFEILNDRPNDNNRHLIIRGKGGTGGLNQKDFMKIGYFESGTGTPVVELDCTLALKNNWIRLGAATNNQRYIGYGGVSSNGIELVGPGDDGHPILRIINKTGYDDIIKCYSDKVKINKETFVKIGMEISDPENHIQQPRPTLSLNKLTYDGGTKCSSILFHGENSHAMWKQGEIYSTDIAGYGGSLTFATKVTTNGATGELTDRMVINQDGNVGIGTASPSQKLHVDGILKSNGHKIVGSNPSIDFEGDWVPGNYFRITGYDTSKRLEFNYDDGTILADNRYIRLWTGIPHAERMIIDPNGNVGIGTDNPTEKLYVNGNIYGNKLYTDTNIYSNSNMYLNTSNTVRMAIDTSGNVGIGTTNPSGLLHLDWSRGDHALRITGDHDVGNAQVYVTGATYGMNITTNNSYHNKYSLKAVGSTGAGLVVYNNGFVGIGTASPDFPLEVQSYKNHLVNTCGFLRYIPSSNSFFSNISAQTTRNVCIRTNGDLWSNASDRSVIISSDIRIKTNIENIPDNFALEKIRKIETKQYNFIDKLNYGDYKGFGFIAQEVKDIMPSAVQTDGPEELIPDIYKIINCNWTNEEDKFKMRSSDLPDIVSGIEYKFTVSNNSDYEDEKEIALVGNEDNTFTFDKQYRTVFCYGKKINDFHTMDYNKLHTLNFAATKDIDRIQQQHIIEIETLKSENIELKEKLTELTNKIKNATTFEDLKNSL